MKIKVWDILRVVTLLTSVVTLVLVLKKPAPVAQPQTPAAIAANAKSFDEKMEQFSQAARPTQTDDGSNQNPVTAAYSITSSEPKAEVHLTSNEISAAMAEATGAGQLSATTNVGSGTPTIKDERVSFDGDVVHGQFLAEVAGKDVWVTISGHLGSKDGYATFDPTEFKVGDMNVPVALVNPALQKKLAEQNAQLKLPEYVGGIKVENGELVMQQK
jgi:hypothetical protein